MRAYLCFLILVLSSSSYSQYIFGVNRLTWYSARDWCREMNSELISLHSNHSFYDLINALDLHLGDGPITSHWIGLYHDNANPHDSSTYKWSDSSPFDYGVDVSGGVTPWKRIGGKNPNSVLNPSCVRLQNNADPKWAWDDIECNATNGGLQAIPICFFSSTANSDPTMNTSISLETESDPPTGQPTASRLIDFTLSPTSEEPSVIPSEEPSTTTSPSFEPTSFPTNTPSIDPLEYYVSPNTAIRSTPSLPITSLDLTEDDENDQENDGAKSSKSSKQNILSLMSEHQEEAIVLLLLVVTLCACFLFTILIFRTQIILVVPVPLSRAHQNSENYHPTFHSIRSRDSVHDAIDHDF